MESTAETNTTTEVLDAARSLSLDIDAITRRVDAVLGEPLYWFPVRHHSPAIARQLGRAIRERQPKIVFIEGPSEAQAMVEFVTDPKTRPPVAIYSSFRRDNPASTTDPLALPLRHSAWFPLVSYSPEYVAMLAAKSIGADAVFIDLPHFAIDEEPAAPPDSAPAAPVSPAPPPPPKPGRRDLDDIGPTTALYRALAAAAGYRSWDETWDRLFETPRPDDSYESLRRDVALFCAAVRATASPEALIADGTIARERFMLQTIRRALADRRLDARDALVACGGFHLFLDRDDPTPPPPVPQGPLSVTVAPYSYFRLSQLSGYGAGNRAPRFYEMCFDHHAAGDGQREVVVEYVVDIVKEARSRCEPLSPADAIAAAQHALMLAHLRGRRDPVLDDIHDALVTTCCKGNPRTEAARLFEAIDEVNIGTKLGRVTDRIGRLPTVADFYEQLARLDLESLAAREKVQNLTLDKRQPLDAARSAFLHRMIFLGAQLGNVQREAAPFGQSVFKEAWRIKWSPQIEATLIERSLHGDTVEAAATTRLRESLAGGAPGGEAAAACRRLVQAMDMDLPQLITQADQSAGHAIDHDDRFGSLADALTSLLLLERYAAYRGLGKDRLTDLIQRCFARACLAIPAVAAVPPEQWDQVVAGLLALAEPAMQRADLDANLFAVNVQAAAAVATMPFLRGAFLGMLTEMRRMRPDALAAELAAHARGGVEQQIVAGDFLRGVLRVSRTAILLGASSLVAAIDELLRAADDQTFLHMVPRLRAAFEGLHERQRDSVALLVAERYGLKESAEVRTLTTSVGAARLMAELDAEVKKIMDEWMS